MKKMVKLLVSVVVLSALTGAYFGVKTYVARQEEKEAADEEKAVSVYPDDTDQIQTVEFMADKKECVFKKENDVWIKEDEEDFPVSQDTLTNAVGSLSNMDADRVLEDVENLEEYGLDTPQNTITVITEEDQKTVIRIGMENESTSQYYVSKDEDRSTVYIVPSASVDPFMNSLYDYAEKENFPDVSASEINKVSLKQKTESFSLEKTESGFWNLVYEDGTEEKADSAKVGSLTSSISALEYDQFIDYRAEDRSKYGFDQPYATVTVDYTETIETDEEESEENADTASEEKSDEAAVETEENEEKTIEKTLVFYVGDETEEESRYVMIEGSDQVYTIPLENLNTVIDKQLSDFWNLTVYYLSANNLSKLKIQMDGVEHGINVSRETSQSDSEDETSESTETLVYKLDGKQIKDEVKFTTFYNKLINMTGQQKLEGPYKTKEMPEMSIEFTDTDETVTDVFFYEYDENFYAVARDESVYLVNKMTVKEMISAYEELIS